MFQINRPSEISTCKISALKTLAFSHLFEVDFSETSLMTSAENSVSEPRNLKFSCGRITPDPPKRLGPSALAINMPSVK